MTADFCPTDYFCNQCGSDRKDKKHISIWSGLPCDNQWHDQPAPKPAEPVSATPRTDCLEARLDAGLGVVVSTLSHDEILSNQLEESLEHARQLERELAEAKLDLIDTKALLENINHQERGGKTSDWWSVSVTEYRAKRKAEARAAELQAELIKEQELTEGLSRLSSEVCNQRNELQAKLDTETKRADGAHNAAIDKCIKALAHDSLAVRILLPFKVPQ